MPAGRWWIALVTFERCGDKQDVLPDWAQGACGWMVAIASDEESARHLLLRDVGFCGLRVLEITDLRELLDEGEIGEIDSHLAENFRNIESNKQTVWGTIHGYIGDGEA